MLKNSSKKKQTKTRGIFEVELFSYQLAVLLETSQESYDACLQSCRDSPELKEGVFVEGLQDFTDRSLLLNDVWWMMMYGSTENIIYKTRLVIQMTFGFCYWQYNHIYQIVFAYIYIYIHFIYVQRKHGCFLKPRRDPMVRFKQSGLGSKWCLWRGRCCPGWGKSEPGDFWNPKRWSDCMIATKTNVSSLRRVPNFPKLSIIFPRHRSLE